MTDQGHARPVARRRAWPWVLLVVLLVLIGMAVAMALDALHARDAAGDMEAAASHAEQAVQRRDAAALAAAVEGLRDGAVRFSGATDGPVWWLAARTPWVGTQVVPLQQAGASARAIAEDALTPLAQGGDLAAFEIPRIVDGGIDPWVLEPYRAALVQADATFAAELDALAAVDVGGSLAAIREPYLLLQERLAPLAGMVATARLAADLLPTVLGGEGPREYVVVVQNNAEPRATGGIPGALISLTVDQGRMTMGDYEVANALETGEPVASLTADEREVFSARMAHYPMDANFTPQFPRTAALLAAFWEAARSERPDGVISVDAVALGYLLEGAPATSVDGFTIDATNVVDVLLEQAYAAYDTPDTQDAFFAAAAAALFDAIIGGDSRALDGAAQAVTERRLLLWLADEGEQRSLADTTIGGDFLARDDALGAFLNDGSGSKIGWYIDTSYALTDVVCADGALAGETLTVDLAHTFDGEVGSLPDTVGLGGGFVPAGEFHANLMVYPPRGAWVSSVTADGASLSWNSQVHDGRSVATVRVALAPGEARSVTVGIATAPGVTEAAGLVVTPGPRASDVVHQTVEGGADDCP